MGSSVIDRIFIFIVIFFGSIIIVGFLVQFLIVPLNLSVIINGFIFCIVFIIVMALLFWQFDEKKIQEQKKIQKIENERKEKYQNSAPGWYDKGEEYLKNGHKIEAIKCYDKAIEIDQNYTKAWNQKGHVFLKMGLNEDAIECYEKTIEINSNNYIAWFNKGSILLKIGLQEEAICCFEKVIDISPHSDKVEELIIQKLGDIGLEQQAIRFYDKVNEKAPTIISEDFRKQMIKIWKNRGIELENQERYLEAIEYYDRALQTEGKERELIGELLLHKGCSYHKINLYRKAIECYDLITEDVYTPGFYISGHSFPGHYDPSNYPISIKCSAWLNKGIALNYLGLNEEAIECCLTAIKLDSKFARAWSYMGIILEDLDRYQEATHCFNRALEIDPNDRLAKENIASFNK